MRQNIENDVMYYTFDIFSDIKHIRHCFSTKLGGVSVGDAASMNLAFKRDSKRENVYKNFEILCETIGFNYDGIVLVQQEHTSNVDSVTRENRGNILITQDNLGEIDGLVTNEKGVVISTLHADCVPIYFFDPVKNVIGLCHAGWRGTVNSITRATLEKMIDTYGCSPADVLVGIGPSIGMCCFEVDTPVKDEFEIKLPFSKEYIKEGENDKYYIDMWNVNKQILVNAGVLSYNIEIGDVCTRCNNDIFHSHRATGFNRGCMVAMFQIVESG